MQLKPKVAKKKGLVKKPLNKNLKNIFNVDEEESPYIPDEKEQIKQAAKVASDTIDKSKVESEWSKMLEQDPTVFDFDEYYEEEVVKADLETQEKEDEVEFKKPKYIQSLLQKAKERKDLIDLAKEKSLQKALEKEESEGLEVEQFITPSYKKKLEEKKALEEAERQKEIEERKNSAEGRGNMMSFYQNILDTSQGPSKKRSFPVEKDLNESKRNKKID